MTHAFAQFETPKVRRYEIYTAVHKGLRLAHGRMLARIGSTDPQDLGDVSRMAMELRSHLAMCRSHLDHEDSEIHTALEARAKGASSHAEDGHDDHARSFGELEAWISQLTSTGLPGREEALAHLYRRFALFVAHDLEHMHIEETEIQTALQDAFSDEELQAIEGRILGKISPDLMARFLSVMLPAMNAGERRDMVGGMKASMPAEVFEGLADGVLRPNLTAEQIRALSPLL